MQLPFQTLMEKLRPKEGAPSTPKPPIGNQLAAAAVPPGGFQ